MAKKGEGNTSNVADVKGATKRNIPCEVVYLGVQAVAGNRGHCAHLGWLRSGKRAGKQERGHPLPPIWVCK